MFDKDYYFKKIELKKFKNSTYFKKLKLAINQKETEIILNIVKTANDFNIYVKGLSEISDEGYLVLPMNKIILDENDFMMYDIYLLDVNLVVKKKCKDINDIDYLNDYYSSLLMLKKNIDKVFSFKIENNNKINLLKRL